MAGHDASNLKHFKRGFVIPAMVKDLYTAEIIQSEEVLETELHS